MAFKDLKGIGVGGNRYGVGAVVSLNIVVQAVLQMGCQSRDNALAETPKSFWAKGSAISVANMELSDDPKLTSI